MKNPLRNIFYFGAIFLFVGLSSTAFSQGSDVVPDLKGCKLGMTLGEFHDKMYGEQSDYWGSDRHALGWYMFLAPLSEQVAPQAQVAATLGGGPATISFRFNKNGGVRASIKAALL